MVTSKLNGRKIVFKNDKWVYVDTGKPIKTKERKMTKKIKIDETEVKSIWEKVKDKKWYIILGVAVAYVLCEFVFKIGFPAWIFNLIAAL